MMRRQASPPLSYTHSTSQSSNSSDEEDYFLTLGPGFVPPQLCLPERRDSLKPNTVAGYVPGGLSQHDWEQMAAARMHYRLRSMDASNIGSPSTSGPTAVAQSLMRIEDALAAITRRLDADAARRENEVLLHTGSPLIAVPPIFPPAQPLPVVTSASHLLGLSKEDLVEQVRQHTGRDRSGSGMLALRLALGAELGLPIRPLKMAATHTMAAEKREEEDRELERRRSRPTQNEHSHGGGGSKN